MLPSMRNLLKGAVLGMTLTFLVMMIYSLPENMNSVLYDFREQLRMNPTISEIVFGNHQETLNPLENLPENEETKETYCNVPPLTNIQDFFNFGRREKMHCGNLKMFGGIRKKDGSKLICLDERFQIVPGKCIVLSFGINNEWSFDDAMDKFGCNVYAFDPTIGKDDFNRTERIHFYNLGLSDAQKTKQINNKLCKVDRYENILKMLGLIDADIDYLKMDIEGSEIDFFRDVFKTSPHLLKKVKQISMEIHPTSPPLIVNEITLKYSRFFPLWQGMHHLECLGFRLVNYEMNPVRSNHYRWEQSTESSCYEVVWARDINT